eukprot:3621759-Alexandrium_andersonii.AAC.1
MRGARSAQRAQRRCGGLPPGAQSRPSSTMSSRASRSTSGSVGRALRSSPRRLAASTSARA